MASADTACAQIVQDMTSIKVGASFLHTIHVRQCTNTCDIKRKIPAPGIRPEHLLIALISTPAVLLQCYNTYHVYMYTRVNKKRGAGRIRAYKVEL